MIPWALLIKIAIVAAVVGVLVVACNRRDAGLVEQGRLEQRAIDLAEADKLKAAAALALAAALEDKEKTERALRQARYSQEVANATNRKTVAELGAQLRDLAPDGRLRDPNAAGGCGGGSGGAEAGTTAGPAAGAGNAGPASGLLSTELSGLLQRLAEEADEVNLAYIACRADAYSTRGLTP